MADQQYTDAQLSDGRTLRFIGNLAPDQVAAKVKTFRTNEAAQQITANPPGVRPSVPPELNPGMTLTNQGAMPYGKAVTAGPNQPAGQAESGMGFGTPASQTIKDAAQAVGQGATYATPAMFAPASLLGRMLLTGGASGAQAALGGGSPKDIALSAGGGALAQGAGEKILGNLPSVLKARAGPAFQQASKAAGNLPINISGPGNVALESQSLAESGGSMPKVMRDFIKRTTDPSKSAMTYDEARQFYSNASRLSADEAQRLTPVMKRQVGKFAGALGDSIQDTANQAGAGAQYSGAMKDYSRAMRMQDFIDMLKSNLASSAAKAVGGGIAGYGATKAVEQVLKKK